MLNFAYLCQRNNSYQYTGACPGFLKGGSNILGSIKKGHQIFKGGSNGLMGGRVQYISLPRMTNLAYLDAKDL